MLEDLYTLKGMDYKVVAIDPLSSRREKMRDVLLAITDGRQVDKVAVEDIDNGKKTVERWTDGFGCNGVLEVSRDILRTVTHV